MENYVDLGGCFPEGSYKNLNLVWQCNLLALGKGHIKIWQTAMVSLIIKEVVMTCVSLNLLSFSIRHLNI